jgi:hypothetical protein
VVKHDRLIGQLHRSTDRFLDRLDDLRRYLAGADVLAQQDAQRWQFATYEARGAAVVGAEAELEAMTRTFIQETHAELNGMAIPLKDVRPSLRQLAAHSAFESLRTTTHHKTVWERRLFATTLDSCVVPLALPVAHKGAQPPLDGKTLRPSHFFQLWQIYGLPQSAFPEVAWVGSLQKLALARNDVAHGNSKFDEIFVQPGREVHHIEAYLDQMSLFGIHFVSRWEEYLRASRYMANP